MWHIAKKAVPHFTVQEQARLYAAIMRGDVQVTIAYDQKGLLGVVLTVLYKDPILGNNNLMIYGIYSLRRVKRSQWRAAFNELLYQAKQFGCDCISAYTHLRSISRLMSRLGARELTYMWLSI